MLPSPQAFVLTLAALAIGGTQGLKLKKRADPVDTSNIQGAQNILITNAEQTLFYTPMQLGSGSSLVNIFGLVSTTRLAATGPPRYIHLRDHRVHAEKKNVSQG
jgi:hypothetical protein